MAIGNTGVNGHEGRVLQLEREVGDLRVHNAKLITSMEHLVGAVEGLNSTVQELRDTMNKGRGALWFAMLLAGGIGASVTTLIKAIFLKV